MREPVADPTHDGEPAEALEVDGQRVIPAPPTPQIAAHLDRP
jgi:hypothetical protein